MEHRWGKRVTMDAPIRLTAAHLSWVSRSARLRDVSLSGGLIVTEVDLRILSQLLVIVRAPRPTEQASVIGAYVTRKYQSGIGIEWCDFAPPTVVELLRAAIERGRRPQVSARLRAETMH
jgi:hypothetical protein